ncbi:MAG: hypothetical protein IKL10_05125 [Clostridia bacterium]|nr:hypothetical protein [Clostridia bacterium]
MRNEDFLEMLGNIDDSIIDECILAPVVKKKPRYVKYITTLAAVFLLTVCAVLISRIAPEGLLTVFVGEDYTASENSETEITDFFEESTSELHSEEPAVTEEPSLTEEPSFSEVVTDIETTVPPVPENTTMSDITMSSEETTVTDILSDTNGPYFVEVPYGNLLFAGTDGIPNDYPESKRVSLPELLRIYGMIIIPSVIGEFFPEYQSVINDTNEWNENLFRFTLSDGSTLNVAVSNHGLSLTQAEEENMDYTSEIEGVSVLLLKGYESENEMIFSAYFEKNGVHFRITQQGASLSEEYFVNIIKSVI